MEDLYSIHPGISRAGGAASEASVAGAGGAAAPSDLTELMKAQIASHPRYPSLLSAYIECRKVRVRLLRAERSCEGSLRMPRIDRCFSAYVDARRLRARGFLISRWERLRRWHRCWRRSAGRGAAAPGRSASIPSSTSSWSALGQA